MRVRIIAAVLFGVLILIQAVPYGHERSNPATTGTPTWDSPRTEELVRRACFACHSNETSWPWYSSIAPVSWQVSHNVEEGRVHMNFSEFDRGARDAHEAADEVREGEMPPWDYLVMHPEARLSGADKRDLVAGLLATFAGSAERGGLEQEEEEDDD